LFVWFNLLKILSNSFLFSSVDNNNSISSLFLAKIVSSCDNAALVATSDKDDINDLILSSSF
jgi:hypothetical protein